MIETPPQRFAVEGDDPNAFDAIRGYWGIENRAHEVHDATMAKVAPPRVRKNPGVLARIRSFVASILRLNGVENFGMQDFNLPSAGSIPS